MNFQLLALTGKYIAILVVLLVIVAVQLCSVGFLVHSRFAKKSRKQQKSAHESADDQTSAPRSEQAALQSQSELSQAEQEQTSSTGESRLPDVSDDVEPSNELSPTSAESSEEQPEITEDAQPDVAESDFTDEQVEAMLDEFDDASAPQAAATDSDDESDLDSLLSQADEEPTEEPASTLDEEENSSATDSDDEARAFADRLEQNLASLTEQSDDKEPQDDETDQSVPVDLAENGDGSETSESSEDQTEPEQNQVTDYVESTAETVEEILEEHGLTSEDEITEEIAEEIMAVHTAHDETAVEVVAVDGLYKKYSKKADWAVANVNFHCYEGEIVGLLGHNGAGKSTTLKCLEGMLPFDEGTIYIYGHDIVKDPISAKANMGFVTDNHAVFIKMTGMQYLAFMADVYNVPTDVRKERVAKLEEVFQLGNAINNLISSYSHGMRQKICMMGSLIHQPKLWVLDEPMTGLDPRTMHAVQTFMREYADAGNCIIFSSHALITVAKMCDRVVLLRTGCQLDELNIKRIMTVDPTFDFEEYFLKHERQD